MWIKATLAKLAENNILLTGTERILSDGEAIKHLNLMGSTEVESEEIMKAIRTKTSIELLTDAEMDELLLKEGE